MRNYLLLILIYSSFTTTIFAESDDDKIIWTSLNQQAEKLDFTPDDNYVISWTNEIRFWNIANGKKDFFIETESVGDFESSYNFLVFAQDSTPKLINWRTKEVTEGFRKEHNKLGVIRTAKTRNEFMAKTIDAFKHTFFKDNNTLYFWDIETKEKIDSIVSLTIFDKDNYRWGRKTIEYDYFGESDEFVIIKYADNNSYEIPIEPKNHMINYFYHIYNLQTKELLDSIFVFQSTIENNGVHVDKIQVMSNRSKVAWNNKSSIINFYNSYPLTIEKTLKLDFQEEVNEMKFSTFEDAFYVSRPNSSKYLEIYNYKTLELQHQFTFLNYLIANKVAFNSNNSIIAFCGIDSLGNNVIGVLDKNSSKLNVIQDPFRFNIYQEPLSQSIQISIQFEKFKNFRLSLYDISGRLVETLINDFSDSYNTNFGTESLARGTYFFKLDMGTKSISKQYIKE